MRRGLCLGGHPDGVEVEMRSQSSGDVVDILEAFLGARGARGARSNAAGDRVRRGPATLGPHVCLHHSAPTHVLKSENETVDVRVALPVQFSAPRFATRFTR